MPVRKNVTSEDLSHLIASLFDLKDRVAGLADRHGKIYDMDWVCRNLGLLPRC